MAMKTNISVIALAALMAVPAVPALAQDNSANSSTQATSASQSDQTQDQTKTWKNPKRIADIESQDQRIRAMSVLIGQSVYDDMLTSKEATSMQSSDKDSNVSASASNSTTKNSASSSNSSSSDSSGSAGMKSSSDSSAATTGKVNVMNLNDMYSGDVAKGLAKSAQDNAAQVGKLQSFMKKDKNAQAALQAKGFTELDVVAVQYNADGSVDLYVVPQFKSQ